MSPLADVLNLSVLCWVMSHRRVFPTSTRCRDQSPANEAPSSRGSNKGAPKPALRPEEIFCIQRWSEIMGENSSAKLKIALASSGYGGSLHDDTLDFLQVGEAGAQPGYSAWAAGERCPGCSNLKPCSPVHCMRRRSTRMLWRSSIWASCQALWKRPLPLASWCRLDALIVPSCRPCTAM